MSVLIYRISTCMRRVRSLRDSKTPVFVIGALLLGRETSLHAAEGVYRANTSGQLDASGRRARVPLFVWLNKILLYEQAARTSRDVGHCRKRQMNGGRAKEKESYKRFSTRCIEIV